jgi:DNA invertase Pin-like site-specific DNA recombinase
MDLGYARVSTGEQDLSGQIAELQAAGCAKIYSEKASGARDDRAELARVIKRLQPGDVLVVTRLARSTRDLLNVLEAVKQARRRIPFAQGRMVRHHHTSWGAVARTF